MNYLSVLKLKELPVKLKRNSFCGSKKKNKMRLKLFPFPISVKSIDEEN